MQYDPGMKEAYAWWTMQFIEGLYVEANSDLPKYAENMRTIVVLAARASGAKPQPGEIIYFEIPEALDRIQSMQAEVHIYLFSSLKPNKIIVKFEDVAEQINGPVKRLVGFVLAKNMLSVFDAADLDANPRSAKAGAVTQAIIESIETDPTIFPFKTKGILVGSSSFSTLQRHRYELRFMDTQLEGVLDGGHNMLAIGTHILSRVIDDPRQIKRIKLWDDFKEAWTANRAAIDAIRDRLMLR